jgi:tetratricopeptide (TPR) repeat protein
MATTQAPPTRGKVALALLAALVGLSALTVWNVTRSEALEDARRAVDRGDLVHALQGALDHLDRRPWSREAALLAARCFSRLDRADDAEPYYQRAGALALDDLHVRAFGLMRCNHRDRAIRAYEDILARSPRDVLALRRLAGIQLTERRNAECHKLADRLIAIPEGAAIGSTLQGMLAHQEKNREAAVAAYEHVLVIDPDLRAMPFPRRIFWTELASDLISLGRPADAARFLERAVAVDRDVFLMNALGWAYDQNGQQADAERCYLQAVAIDAHDYAPHLNLGRLELHRRHTTEALAHLERAVELAPRQYEALYNLSLAYRQLGRTADADRIQERLRVRRARAAAPARSSHAPVPRYEL